VSQPLGLSSNRANVAGLVVFCVVVGAAAVGVLGYLTRDIVGVLTLVGAAGAGLTLSGSV